ncbi:metal-dependent transcriptional regulator [Leptotrichia trevisanii]
MSRSIEDYLKGIYTLKKKKEYSNKKLAEYLNISPASVSEMIKKLVNDDYLTIDKKTVKLTEKGNGFALDIIRKHRVWEVFLFEKLGYDKEEVHKEAEILEHVTSDKLLQKLEKFLFYPKECPHGSPIFYDVKNFNEENIIKLSEAEEDDEIAILSVEDNIELYDYLRDLSINLKEEYIVEKKDPFDGPIYLKSKANNKKVVAFNAATMIKVYKKNEDMEETDYE